MWDLRQRENKPIFSLKKMEDYVSAIVTNKEGKYLVCASGDGCLTTFNIPGKKLHVQVCVNRYHVIQLYIIIYI